MHHLAQLNLARLRHPLEDAESAEFAAALDPVNRLGEVSPGFVWRLMDEDGASSLFVGLPEIDDPLMIVNYSIWTDLESLRHFVYKSGHVAYLRRRREWFEPLEEAGTVLWWIPAGDIPFVSEAYARLMTLRSSGPSADGWSLNQPHPSPDQA